VGLFAAIAAGIVFRLIWIGDVEYKADEAWTFDQVQAFWQTHRVPLVGMRSSTGLPNPAMSIWVFLALSSVVPADTPLALTRAVQVVNVGAILLLAAFALVSIGRTEREPWLWSIALVSVNPFAVLFSRKIWAQDALPLFTLGALAGWWYRGRWWGGFAWGMLGAVLGQIHMAGFFFAAAFVGCTLFFDRGSVRWSGWFAGSILGSLPMLPWLTPLIVSFADFEVSDMRQWLELISLGGLDHVQSANLGFYLPVYLLQWFNMSLGIGLGYSLGADFVPFLSFPYHTYLASVPMGGVMVIFFIILLRLYRGLRMDRFRTIELMFDPQSSTALALNAGFLGYGFLLTATLLPIYLHYFIITFSLPGLWLAWCVRAGSKNSDQSVTNGRLLLCVLVVAQACITMSFLSYIHEAESIRGDYGVVYHAQPHPQQSTNP